MGIPLVLIQISSVVSVFVTQKSHRLKTGIDRHATGSHISQPKTPAKATVNGNGLTNETEAEYSSNWSGAVLTAPPSGTIFTSVSAQITVPSPVPVNGQAGAASAWVGIDGDIYQNAILQTGIDFRVDSNNAVSYSAWYEWYPDYAYDFSSINISTGDVISLSVVSSDSSSGTATIKNLSNGQMVSRSLFAPNSSATLSGQNTEWIVEDFSEDGAFVPFANFGTVKFTSAAAGVSDGYTIGTSGSVLINIIDPSGRVLASASTPSDSEITVQSHNS